jgi:hypothetical protein
MKMRGEWAALFGFHFGFQTSITQRHLASRFSEASSRRRLFGCSWMTLDSDLGGLKIRVSVRRRSN